MRKSYYESFQKIFGFYGFCHLNSSCYFLLFWGLDSVGYSIFSKLFKTSQDYKAYCLDSTPANNIQVLPSIPCLYFSLCFSLTPLYTLNIIVFLYSWIHTPLWMPNLSPLFPSLHNLKTSLSDAFQIPHNATTIFLP